jgi:hypothetical protein
MSARSYYKKRGLFLLPQNLNDPYLPHCLKHFPKGPGPSVPLAKLLDYIALATRSGKPGNSRFLCQKFSYTSKPFPSGLFSHIYKENKTATAEVHPWSGEGSYTHCQKFFLINPSPYPLPQGERRIRGKTFGKRITRGLSCWCRWKRSRNIRPWWGWPGKPNKRRRPAPPQTAALETIINQTGSAAQWSLPGPDPRKRSG